MGARAIGRFDIKSEAASGAAGTVYRALDRGSGELVAVKVIRGLSAADTARFAREARLLSQIHHPGVVRYVDHGVTDEGHAYLVMEWLEGEDVRVRLSRTGLSIDESVALGRRVAEALEAIHALGVVHRDLKPANVFLPGGICAEAKVLDFGLIHTEWASAEVTRTGMVVGTPSYMAPEQARGQREIDARADIFSLGCLLFKCLTGSAPFEGGSVLAVLTKVLLEDAPRLRALRPEVPEALEELVMRLLRKDPDQRPASAAAVALELAALDPVGDQGDRASPSPPSALISGLTTGEQRVSAVLLVGAPSLISRSASYPAGTTLVSGPPVGVEVGVEVDVGALVERHGGQLDTLLDGSRVVTLAAPGVATDQAARAARCALALRAALPDAPMAIATGRGEVTRQKPASDAIERAAQLLSGCVEAARAGGAPEIAVDEFTAALLDPRFVVISVSVPVAMGETPKPPAGGGLRLVGMRAVESAARTLLGRPTPMVGREWEIGSIESIFHTCVEEREARPVLVTGAAGMGKSRLAHEAVALLRRTFPSVEVWWARGDPLRAGSPLALLGQVIRSAAELYDDEVPDGGSALEAQRQRFAERIAARSDPSGGGAWVAEVLGEIAGIPFPDEASPALRAARREPRIMSESLRAAWEALVAGACAAGPLVVVLEDLHWADAATVRLVNGALASLERRSWMVLALARPEVHDVFPRLWEGKSLQEIRLAPLTRRACERLARQVLGDAAGADTLQRLALQADGNAFYLEELIRAVGEPRLAPGGPPPEGGSTLPETVLAMVQARLLGLDAGTRRVLRAASVFGEVFWAGGVAALLGGSAPHAGWVDLLVERELIVPRAESRFAGERELAFRHALLREGAYAMLTEGDRVLGHALAGAWLEQQGEGDAMVLAQHFEMALDERRAGHFYRAAALSALRAADIEAAIARATQALAHASSEAERIACLSLLCEGYSWRDDPRRASASADQVIALAAPGSEPWIRALGVKQSVALLLGQTDELGAAIQALTSFDPAPETAVVVAPALAVTIFLLCFGAQLATAAAILARLEVVVGAAYSSDPLALAPLSMARSWVAAFGDGDGWAALGHARQARLLGEVARDTRQVRFAQIFAATSQWSLGLLPEAEAELRAVAPATTDDLLGSVASFYLALVLIERGALDEARALALHRIETGRANAQSLGDMREAEGHWMLGEIAARAGEWEAAERELAANVEILRPAALVWQLAAARLVEVRLARGAVPEALALARELHAAFVVSGGHGIRGTLVRLVHVEALEAAGEGDAARAALREAWDDVQARAALIGDPAVRRRFFEDVPENARVAALVEAWTG